ncbi:lysophosphatidylcholine acyltransferase isoform X1 [Bradysia coprophila]|uniref:lysophosphatidylcholine acyltransferase isoform X1 n=1 Tax=Bradysia coprophila TaxID=38358 RepID=UPI00187DDA65|nr:lysophosphatidylcholine acyltransferase isoform X1 [Bradysia coprophila]
MSSQNKTKTDDDYSNVHIVNPFVHKLKLENTFDKFKTAVLTVVLLPVRVLIICILLVIAWGLASIGLYGLTMEDLQTKPMSGWRRKFQSLTAMSMRAMFVAGSFHNLKLIGKPASPKDAPIVVVAPHSSFFDSIVPISVGAVPCCVLAKIETSSLAFFGKLINFTQPIYVSREDPNSRQNTIKSIIERANSKLDWPQIIIFPEGTCTNRSCLITFKPGAFYPGVPVQPVCIRYPNKLDTVTWTWEGPGVLKLLWLTLTQIQTACEIEFLPVYVPSDEEKKNPKMFANNVRKVMAKALDVPTSDYTYDDCRLMTRAKELNIPNAADIVEIERLNQKISIDQRHIEENILATGRINSKNCYVSLSEFAKLLEVAPNDVSTKLLFSLFRKDNEENIDFRDYLMCAIFLNRTSVPAIQILESISKLYETKVDYVETNTSTKGLLNTDGLLNVMKHAMPLTSDDCTAIFTQLDKRNQKLISFYDLQEWLSSKPEHSHLFKATDLPTKRKIQCDQ